MCKYESPNKLKLLFLVSDFNYMSLSFTSHALKFNSGKEEVGW